MKVSLQVFEFLSSGDMSQLGNHLAEVGRLADTSGFYSLWVMDHFWQMMHVGDPSEPMLEAYSALNFLAGVTQKIKLGALVTGVIYRHPGVLLKSVTTLDVLSGGRAYFGIGAAWYEQEARGLGIPFPSMKERFERLEETLQLAHHMWSGKREAFNGTHYQLAQPINSPQALSKPHPPILIGGGGETKTLKFVAQYGDACNLFAMNGKDVIQRKLEVLKEHCHTLGRNYDEIEKTALSSCHLAPDQMSAQQIVDECGQLAELGISHVIYNMPNAFTLTPLEIFGRDIIPVVANL